MLPDCELCDTRKSLERATAVDRERPSTRARLWSKRAGRPQAGLQPLRDEKNLFSRSGFRPPDFRSFPPPSPSPPPLPLPRPPPSAAPMAEVVAVAGAARAALMLAEMVAHEKELRPALSALHARLTLMLAAVEAMGAAFEASRAGAPVLAALEAATAWVEERHVKMHKQGYVHRAIMGDQTKANIEALDAQLSRAAEQLGLEAGLASLRLEGRSEAVREAVAGLGAAQKALAVEMREGAVRGAKSAEDAAARLTAIEAALEGIKAAAEGWTREKDADGDVYYAKDGEESSWDKPEELARLERLEAAIDARFADARAGADARADKAAAEGRAAFAELQAKADERWEWLEGKLDGIADGLARLEAHMIKVKAAGTPASAAAGAAARASEADALRADAASKHAAALALLDGLADLRSALMVARAELEAKAAEAAEAAAHAQQTRKKGLGIRSAAKTARDDALEEPGCDEDDAEEDYNFAAKKAAKLIARADAEDKAAARLKAEAARARERAADAEARINHAEEVARRYEADVEEDKHKLELLERREGERKTAEEAARREVEATAKDGDANAKRAAALTAIGLGGTADGDVVRALMAIADAKDAAKIVDEAETASLAEAAAAADGIAKLRALASKLESDLRVAAAGKLAAMKARDAAQVATHAAEEAALTPAFLEALDAAGAAEKAEEANAAERTRSLAREKKRAGATAVGSAATLAQLAEAERSLLSVREAANALEGEARALRGLTPVPLVSQTKPVAKPTMPKPTAPKPIAPKPSASSVPSMSTVPMVPNPAKPPPSPHESKPATVAPTALPGKVMPSSVATIAVPNSPTATSNEVPVQLISLDKLVEQLKGLVDAGKAAAAAAATPAATQALLRSERLENEAEALYSRAMDVATHKDGLFVAIGNAAAGFNTAEADAKRHTDEAASIVLSAADKLEKAKEDLHEKSRDYDSAFFYSGRLKEAEECFEDAKVKAKAERDEAARISAAASDFASKRTIAESLLQNASNVVEELRNEAKRIEDRAKDAAGKEKMNRGEVHADALDAEARELTVRARTVRRDALRRYNGGDSDTDFVAAFASIQTERLSLKTNADTERAAAADVEAKKDALKKAEKDAADALKSLETNKLLFTDAQEGATKMHAAGNDVAWSKASKHAENCRLEMNASKEAEANARAAVLSAKEALKGAEAYKAKLPGVKSEAELDDEVKILDAARKEANKLDDTARVKMNSAAARRGVEVDTPFRLPSNPSPADVVKYLKDDRKKCLAAATYLAEVKDETVIQKYIDNPYNVILNLYDVLNDYKGSQNPNADVDIVKAAASAVINFASHASGKDYIAKHLKNFYRNVVLPLSREHSKGDARDILSNLKEILS